MEEVDHHVQLNQVNPTVPNDVVEENNFGSWMLVKKPPRRRYTKQDKQPDKPPSVSGGKQHTTVQQPGITVGQPPMQNRHTGPVEGSRFNILGEDTSPQDPLIDKTDATSTPSPTEHASTPMETVDLGKSSQPIRI